MKVPRGAAWAALAILVAWSAYQRWTALSASPFPIGIDGYFYPIQLRTLLATGHLEYPASPLAFWLMAPLAAIWGPLTGAKLGAALGGAAIAIPAYGVGARFGGGRGAGLVAAALAVTSAGSAYLTIEFVKNGIGLAVALGALWAVLAACERESKRSLRRRVVIAIGLVIAAALAHKMAAALVVAIAGPAVIAEAVARGALRGRRLLYTLVGAGLLVIVVVILGAAAPGRFLSARDALAAGRMFSVDANWDLPALARPELAMGHEAWIGLVLAVVAAVMLALRGRELPAGARVAAWATIAIAIFLALPWLDVADPQGLGFRLRVVAFVPMALCAALALRLVPRFKWQDEAAAAVAVVVVLAMPPMSARTEGQILTHPALANAVQGMEGRCEDGDTVIVPERHIAFMVAWYAGCDVRLRPEGVPYEHRLRLMPLAFIRQGSPLDRAIDDARKEPLLAPPIGLHARHPNGLVLMREGTWDWVLSRLPDKPRAYYDSWPTI